jgi:hypothetical protein
MAECDQLADGLGDDLAVVRRHAMLRVVERRRSDADIAHAEAVAERGEIVILRNRRQQHRADRALLFKEGAHIVEHPVRGAVDGAHEQRKVAVLDRVEHALLKVQHRLRIGIVVKQRDQEIAAKGEGARLRIGHEPQLLDRFLHRSPRLFADEFRPVDDPADRLFRNPGERSHIIDRGLLGPRSGRLSRHKPMLSPTSHADRAPCPLSFMPCRNPDGRSSQQNQPHRRLFACF